MPLKYTSKNSDEGWITKDKKNCFRIRSSTFFRHSLSQSLIYSFIHLLNIFWSLYCVPDADGFWGYRKGGTHHLGEALIGYGCATFCFHSIQLKTSYYLNICEITGSHYRACFPKAKFDSVCFDSETKQQWLETSLQNKEIITQEI
jgi:hypothetical protein